MEPQPSALPRPLSANDEEDICAICLCPLSEQQSIELSCGHQWHLSCVEQQLRQAAPSPSRRLVFNGIRCALCNRVCTHPEIDPLVSATEQTLHRVDQLILEQARADQLYQHPAVTSPQSSFFGNVVEYGRSIYAFYLCSLCRQPYFGGTIDCADASQAELPPDDQLCPSCSPRANVTCTEVSHAPFHIWKCRFCCNRATFVCHGSTHLCDQCHAKDDGVRHRRRSGAHGALNIPPIPCRGRPHCTTPLLPDKETHQNGPSANCEQLLQCAACSSGPVESRGLTLDERGSPNMLFNPSGEHGLNGWRPLYFSNATGGLHWSVERFEFPFPPSRSNFVCSYSWAKMVQVVDLSRFIRDPGTAVIEVSARVRSRTDCPSLFRLECALYDRSSNELQRFKTDEVSPPADCWERVRHCFQPTPRAKYAVICIHGRDARFWNGNYGAKVTACSVRVLFDDSVQDDGRSMLYNDAFRFISAATVGPNSVVRAFARRDFHRQETGNGFGFADDAVGGDDDGDDETGTRVGRVWHNFFTTLFSPTR